MSSIPTRTKSDRYPCQLTAMVVLTENRLLVLDSGNSSLKLFDTSRNEMVSRLSLLKGARDMFKLAEDHVAVYLPGIIQIVSIQGRQFMNRGMVKMGLDHTKISYVDGQKEKSSDQLLFEAAKNQFENKNHSSDLKYHYSARNANDDLIDLETGGNSEESGDEKEADINFNIEASMGSLATVQVNATDYQRKPSLQAQVSWLLCQKRGVYDVLSAAYHAPSHRLFVASQRTDFVRVFIVDED